MCTLYIYVFLKSYNKMTINIKNVLKLCFNSLCPIFV